MKKFKYKELVIRIVIIAVLTASAVIIPSCVADMIIKI